MPTGWQLDPESLKTDKVQVWDGIVMMSLVPLETAKRFVAEKKAFVCTDQSVTIYNLEEHYLPL